MRGDDTQVRTQAKSAGRALDVLELLGQERVGLTFTDLVHRLKYPKSSLHELLSLMNERGFVDVDPETRKYSLGIKVWEVGQAYVRHREIVAVALDQMHKIVATINETVQLAILDRTDNVYLAKVDCTHPLRIQTDVGKRFPSHATALGKVLLSHLPPEEVRVRLDGTQLIGLTPRTITNYDELLRNLDTTRRQGFGVDWEEGMEGLRCVAVAVRDHSGVVAAISTSVPVFRASSDQMSMAIRQLATASLAISKDLGAPQEDATIQSLLNMSDESLIGLYEQSKREPS